MLSATFRSRAPMRVALMALCALALTACGVQLPNSGLTGNRAGTVQVALLVPSGAADPGVATLAASLTNAAKLAAAEAGTNGVTVDLRVYDTGGNAAQTAQVTSRALSEGAQVIVGPLYSQNANAAGLAAASSGVPVMTFSNTPGVAGGNVFLLGNTFDNTAQRLVGYARGQGLNRFMIVSGASAAEEAGAAAIRRAVQSQGGQLVDAATFQMSQEGVTAAAPGIAQRAQANGAQAVVLTSDPGLALPFVARALPENGLSPSDVRYIGLTRWDQPASALALPGLQGGWFAWPDQAAATAFANRYAAAYGTAPPNVITFLGYDGVIAAATLAGSGGNYSPATVAAQRSFPGGNGAFRFLSDGTNRRALAVAQVRNNTVQIIDQARLGSAGF